jgi:hypothetical protein
MTRAISVVGRTRSSIRVLTELTMVAQLGQVAFAADHARDVGHRLDHLFLGLDDVVQGIGDLAGDAGPVGRHAYRKVTFFQGHQRGQQQLDIELFRHVGHRIH